MFQHSTNEPIRYKSLDFLGYPKYRVGSDGSVWSYVKIRQLWKKLKQSVRSDGRLVVGLYDNNGGIKQFQVHRLVLLAFVGPCPDGMESCHFPDRDPKNNNLYNLRWDTKSQNCLDRTWHGMSNYGKHYNQGEKANKAKLTEKVVIEIRELFATRKYTQLQLADMFGVLSGSTISGIVRGIYWSHVGGPIVKVGHGRRPKK